MVAVPKTVTYSENVFRGARATQATRPQIAFDRSSLRSPIRITGAKGKKKDIQPRFKYLHTNKEGNSENTFLPPFFPIYDIKGEYIAFHYEGNIFSPDGSYWYAYIRYVVQVHSYKPVLAATGKIDGNITEDGFWYTSAGPLVNHILQMRPPTPAKPPLPSIKFQKHVQPPRRTPRNFMRVSKLLDQGIPI